MSPLRLAIAISLVAASASGAPPPSPQELFLSQAPGVQALAVRIDAEGTAQVWTCPAAPCATGSFAAVTLASKLPAPRVLESIYVGDGKRVVHVRAELGGGVAYEAIVAGKPEGPIVFSGKTGFTQGQEGERTGQMVEILDDGPAKVVVIADAREDLRICDQAMTPLSPRVLDPKTLELRGATVPRLPRQQRADAKEVVASAHAGALTPPIARLLVAAGASSAIGAPQNIVDGDPSTAWSEARGGDGHGEFVLLRAPAEVPIARLAIVPIPASSDGKLTAPRKLFLVTPNKILGVTLPEDAAMHPGQAYDVPLPEPIKTSCVSLVLEDAYAKDKKPDVTIAELYAYSELESNGATVDAIARELGAGGARAQAAADILKRAGGAGAKAILATLATFDPTARGLALEIASSVACDEGAPLLVASLADKEPELARRARTKLERCGTGASAALIAALGGADFAMRARVAPILGSTAPALAIDPLVKALGEGPSDARAEIRGALTHAIHGAPREKVAALVSENRATLARIDLLRALATRLHEVTPEATSALDGVLGSSADFPTRYLALEPLVTLATSDAALLPRVTGVIAKDPEWPARARAIELAARVPQAQGAIVAALGDPEPRVREAALRAVTEAKTAQAAPVATQLLKQDPWTFVRSASARALGAMSGSDAELADAAKTDEAPSVRAASLEALGAHRAKDHAPVAIAALEDKEGEVSVRVSAAHALAGMCDARGLGALTTAARFATSPIASLEDLTVATASLRALAAIHPSDLRARLAPLIEPGARAEIRRAAEGALQEQGICK